MHLNVDKCYHMQVCFMKKAPNTDLILQNKVMSKVDCVKILGIIVSENLKWDNHINNLAQRANGKLCMLKILKKFCLSQDELLTIYKGYIRSLLEYATPVWNAGLTSVLITNLERLQKRSLRIILGDSYTNYNDACLRCNIEPLYERRQKLCLSFAKQLKNHPDFEKWLPDRRGQLRNFTLRNDHYISQFKCRTDRYKNSPLPYFVRLLNS